jgi:phytoene dehydrogenase-like protein
MTHTADVVVAGGGHNGLITAAYLARAGYECAILDARSIPGGGAATQELLLPGYGIDSCSTGHTLIRVNPLILEDELGLVSKYGLTYVDPDPVAHVAFPDGEQLTMSLSLDDTIKEIARFSEHDAESYARVIAEYDDIKSVFGRTRFKPLGMGPSTDELLDQHPQGRIWKRRSMLTSRKIIEREYESRHVRAFMGWMSLQTGVPLETPGSGLLAYSLISGRQANSWSIPLGGSGELVTALVGYLTDHGATIHTDTTVSELLLEDGRCVGVRTADGEEFRGRHGVVSTIHVKHLVDMAPAEAWGDDFLYGVDTYELGMPAFAGYFATTEPPVFDTPDGGRTAVSAGATGWLEDLVDLGRTLADGELVEGVPWLLVATPTLADRSRTPEGETVKLLSFNVYDIPGRGPGGWETEKEVVIQRQLEHVRKFAPNFTDDVILASMVRSPVDFEVANPHMVQGTIHGGDRGLAYMGSNRPSPGWAQHRMPIPGLYQTGGTTHPGGSITGAPGRNAAIVMLQDLGRDPAEVMSL